MFFGLFNFRRSNPVPAAPVEARPVQASAAYLHIAALPEDKEVGQLADEMDRDYQVDLAGRVIKSEGKTCVVKVVHNAPGDPRAEAMAEYLRDLWHQTFGSMFESRGKGRVAYEKVNAYDSKNNLNYVRKLEALPFAQTSMIVDERTGRFEGIKLGVKGDQVCLPPDRSWWLALRPSALRPHGNSDYTGSPYEVWKTRQHLFRLRLIGARRQILGVAKAHIPPTVKDPHTNEQKDNFSIFAEQYQQVQSAGCMMFSNARDKDGNYEQDIEFAEPTDLGPIDAMIDGTDAEMLRAFGITESVLMEVAQQPAGSYAKMSEQRQLLRSQVEDLVDEFVMSFNKYVAAKAPAHNWPTGTAPTFRVVLVKEAGAPNEDLRGPSEEGAPGADGGATNVAATALNGDQIDSMLSIVEQVSAGTLPVDSAETMITAAFPTLSTQQIQNIIKPLRGTGSAVDGGVNGKTATGELGSLSRQQLIRNWKAIDDVLDRLKAGEHSETKAVAMLRALGLEDQTISDLISDAKGQTNGHGLN